MKNLILLTTIILFTGNSTITKAQWFSQDNPSQNNSLKDIFVFNKNNAIVVGETGTVLKTLDGGENWLTLPHDTTYWQNSVYFVNDSAGWIAGSGNYLGEGQIQKTTDGGNNWIGQYNGGYAEWFNSVHFSDENNGWVAGVYAGDGPPTGITLMTMDSGVNWVYKGSGGFFFGGCTSVFFINVDTGWVVGSNWEGGKITKTTDGGDTWFEQITGVTNGLSDICLIDYNHGWVVGYNGMILATTDGGINWIMQVSGTNNDLYSVHFVDENNGWTVGENGIILNTTNGGENWIIQQDGTINHLYSVHFTDENTGWVVGENGTILKTTNGGDPIPVELTSFTAIAHSGHVELNWSTATETNNMMFEIERRKEDSEFLTIGYVEGNGTITETKNYSFTDHSLKPGKYDYRLNQIDFDGSYEYSEVIEVEIELPDEFVLKQNFPNPFNPSTKINFSIPDKEFVSIKVYDVMGKEIVVLVNEEKPAGIYSVEFDASGLSSGTYFYKLTSGNNIEVRKMILLK